MTLSANNLLEAALNNVDESSATKRELAASYFLFRSLAMGLKQSSADLLSTYLEEEDEIDIFYVNAVVDDDLPKHTRTGIYRDWMSLLQNLKVSAMLTHSVMDSSVGYHLVSPECDDMDWVDVDKGQQMITEHVAIASGYICDQLEGAIKEAANMSGQNINNLSIPMRPLLQVIEDIRKTFRGPPGKGPVWAQQMGTILNLADQVHSIYESQEGRSLLLWNRCREGLKIHRDQAIAESRIHYPKKDLLRMGKLQNWPS